MLRIIFAAILATIAGRQCFALDMNWATDEHEKLAYLNLWGTIQEGDDQKFRAIVTPLLQKGYLIFQINVFSSGGNVAAAIGIGKQIRTLQTRTTSPYKFADIINDQRVVQPTPTCTFKVNGGGGYITESRVQGYSWCTCASACFLLWASGMVREGGADVIGVHRITYTESAGRAFGQLSAPQAREMYEQGQKMFQAYLDELDVPRTIVDRLWATDSQNMYFLNWPEVQLMSSTPFLEEQTLARCGPDRSTHMTAENGWTAWQDVQHVNCYRGLLKELMREGAQKYLASIGESMAGMGGPFFPIPGTTTGTTTITALGAPSQQEEPYWDHNGSRMRLESSGTARKFVYQVPRERLIDAGVTAGTVLFNGRRQGNQYVGTAYRFSKLCGPMPYRVEGTVAEDQRSVQMFGRKPTFDKRCHVDGHEDDTLVFTYRGP